MRSMRRKKKLAAMAAKFVPQPQLTPASLPSAPARPSSSLADIGKGAQTLLVRSASVLLRMSPAIAKLADSFAADAPALEALPPERKIKLIRDFVRAQQAVQAGYVALKAAERADADADLLVLDEEEILLLDEEMPSMEVSSRAR